MMKQLLTLFFGLSVAAVAFAAPKKQSDHSKMGKAMRPAAPTAQLGTEHVFSGTAVNGKYHAGGEAVAKVEQEKKLNVLIGLRRDFRDRLAVEHERLKRAEPAGQGAP